MGMTSSMVERVTNPDTADFFLRSERLMFRWWKESDLPLAMQLWGDDSVSAMLGGPFSPAQVEARLARQIAHRAEIGAQYWPMFLAEDGAFVGCAGLKPWRVEDRVPELGYHLVPAMWGRGLATEAVCAVSRYGFETLGLQELFAGHHPANQASANVLLKAGFVYTGEAFYPPSGMIEPTYLLKNPNLKA